MEDQHAGRGQAAGDQQRGDRRVPPARQRAEEGGAEQGEHEAEAADGRAEEDQRRQDQDGPAPGHRADRRLRRGGGDALDDDRDAEGGERAGEHQREVAGPHPEGGADRVADRGVAEGGAEADEDQPRQDVLDAGALHRRALLGLRPRGLDQRLPERDLVGEHLGERLGRRLLGGGRRGPELGEALADGRVGDRRLQRLVELGEHVVRGAGRGVEPVPDADLEVRQAALGGGRHVGQVGEPLGRGHGIGLHLAAEDLAGGVRGLVAHEVDLAAEQVGHRRAGALVGHGDDLGADRRHEQHAAEVARRADAGVGVGHGVGVGLHVVDQLLERVRLEVLAGDDRHRHRGDEADRREVGLRVVGEIGVERRRRRHADVVQQQRVAVGRGAGRLGGAEGAAGAADVLHDDLLAERLRHRLGDQPGHRVGRPAGGEGHDDRDRPGRIVLGEGRGGDERRAGGAEDGVSHGNLPVSFGRCLLPDGSRPLCRQYSMNLPRGSTRPARIHRRKAFPRRPL